MEERIPAGSEPSAFVRKNQSRFQNPYVGPTREFENGLYNDFQLGWDHARSQWTKDDIDQQCIEMVNKARFEVYKVLKGYRGALYQASEVGLERRRLTGLSSNVCGWLGGVQGAMFQAPRLFACHHILSVVRRVCSEFSGQRLSARPFLFR